MDAMLGQVDTGRVLSGYGTGWRDMIGGDHIAETQEHSGVGDVIYWRRLHRQTIEIGWPADIGGFRQPGIGGTFIGRQPVPEFVALKYMPVLTGVCLSGHMGSDKLFDFAISWPQLGEENRIAIGVAADRFGVGITCQSGLPGRRQ